MSRLRFFALVLLFLSVLFGFSLATSGDPEKPPPAVHKIDTSSPAATFLDHLLSQ